MSDKKTDLALDAATMALDATTASTGVPAGSFARLGTTLISGLITRYDQKRMKRAFQDLVEQWALVGEIPEDEADQQVRNLLEKGDPAHDDLLYVMFRHMAFSRSDAAWPYLARMTASYRHAGWSADSFFRRCGWLLERCEDGDIKLLKHIVEASRQTRKMVREHLAEHPGTFETIFWKIDRPGGRAPVGVKVTATVPGREDGGPSLERLVRGDHHLRDVLVLVEESRLGVKGTDERVTFRVTDGHLDKLIDLMCK